MAIKILFHRVIPILTILEITLQSINEENIHMLKDNKGQIHNEGEAAINNTGDKATITVTNLQQELKTLNRTYLYDFCNKFIELSDDAEYSTEFASDIDKKISHNKIDLYRNIFLDCDHYLDDVEDILEDIPRRERIISKINVIYQKTRKFDEWKDEDHLCELVYHKLYNTVANDANSSSIKIEDAETAIHSLMYHAFVKCKLLEPVV